MKIQLSIVFAIVVFLGCGNMKMDKISHTENTNIQESTSYSMTSEKDSLAHISKLRNKYLNREFKKYKIYRLNDTLYEDFNGDRIIDRAVFIKSNGRAGIIITDGKYKTGTRIGFGKGLGDTTDFDWVNYWGILKDSFVWTIMHNKTSGDILRGKRMRLKHISIFLRQDQNEDGNGGGGIIITYDNCKYQLINQAD